MTTMVDYLNDNITINVTEIISPITTTFPKEHFKVGKLYPPPEGTERDEEKYWLCIEVKDDKPNSCDYYVLFLTDEGKKEHVYYSVEGTGKWL